MASKNRIQNNVNGKYFPNNNPELYEQKQLYKWILQLFLEERNKLSIEQLRILHYILGYNATPSDKDSLIDIFEANDYCEMEANEIVSVLQREGFLVIEKPY